MDAPRPKPATGPSLAWQPFTFRGVAAFASAPLARLLVMICLTAALAAGSIMRYLYSGWYPTIEEAVSRLPATGEIRDGRLAWPTAEPETLADSAFLAFLVNPTDQVRLGQSSDLQIEFGQSQFIISSLLGYIALPYPSQWIVALSRPEVAPVWGAWHPALLACAGVFALAALLLMWGVFAGVVTAPLQWYSTLLRRQSSYWGCWRLAVAALQPGAVLMCVAIQLYSIQRLSFVDLLMITGLHLVLDFVYLAAAPLALPRRVEISPFAPGTEPGNVEKPTSGSEPPPKAL